MALAGAAESGDRSSDEATRAARVPWQSSRWGAEDAGRGAEKESRGRRKRVTWESRGRLRQSCGGAGGGGGGGGGGAGGLA
eukprot:994399-Rhodomonas_salina.1